MDSLTDGRGSNDDRLGVVAGIALAEVIDNLDLTGQSRVQLRLPWAPGTTPWARVALPMAGDDRGFFAIPKVGDEVAVAFVHGDVRMPIVLGGVWNDTDPPPADTPLDADMKMRIKSSEGIEIEIDDLADAVTVTTAAGQKIHASPTEITLATGDGTASVTLATGGSTTIETQTDLTLKAASITLDAQTLAARASASASIKSSASCEISGSIVRIN